LKSADDSCADFDWKGALSRASLLLNVENSPARHSENMKFGINDSVISEFLSGLIIVLALVAVGGLLASVLKKMTDRYPFTRLALILALTPISLVRFLDQDTRYLLFTYALIIALMGITIDGIRYLFEFRAQLKLTAALEVERAQMRKCSGESVDEIDEVPAEKEVPKTAEEEKKPSVIVWERVE
jgi:hypothetical protein